MGVYICDYCMYEEGTANCMTCPWANPCLGCKDLDIETCQCKSNGGCGREEGEEDESD